MILGAMIALSVLRIGARAFIFKIMVSPGQEHGGQAQGSHDHGHGKAESCH